MSGGSGSGSTICGCGGEAPADRILIITWSHTSRVTPLPPQRTAQARAPHTCARLVDQLASYDGIL